jgi:hypothetical protein
MKMAENGRDAIFAMELGSNRKKAGRIARPFVGKFQIA